MDVYLTLVHRTLQQWGQGVGRGKEEGEREREREGWVGGIDISRACRTAYGKKDS